MTDEFTAMNLTVVIPTLRRPRNGYAYLRQAIRHNATILCRPDVFSDRFIYFSDCDKDEISSIVSPYRFRFMQRPEHRCLRYISKTSYPYWRMHLCLDFSYCMKQALLQSRSTYLMWLEDDTLLGSDFPDELEHLFKLHKVLHIVSPYHTEEYDSCSACLIFERQSLMEYIKLVDERFFAYIPLDLFYAYHSRKIMPFQKKCAFHIGKYSSQGDGSVVREAEYENSP
jgi:hypothetical protein